MKLNFKYLKFKKWLKENQDRFFLRPEIFDVNKYSFRVRFEGCGDYIYLLVNIFSEFSIWSFYDGPEIDRYFKNLGTEREGVVLQDWVDDWDIFINYCDSGYYCDFHDEDDRTYYSNVDELLIEHSYEPFLNWCNEVLAKADAIVFFDWYTQIGNLSEILAEKASKNANKTYEEQVRPVFIHKIYKP